MRKVRDVDHYKKVVELPAISVPKKAVHYLEKVAPRSGEGSVKNMS